MRRISLGKSQIDNMEFRLSCQNYIVRSPDLLKYQESNNFYQLTAFKTINY